MKIAHFVLTLVAAALVSYATVQLTPARQAALHKATPSLFDEVMARGTIRCGYVITHPFLFKDANTGQLSGIAHDAIEKMADNLQLKIEWTEEVGWSSMLEGLETKRYDMLCSAIWSITNRGLKADFLNPLSYATVHAWAKPDDERFKNGLADVDWSTITIATIDGHISDIMTRTKFPMAKKLSLTDLSSISETFLAVSENKADVTFEQDYVAAEFISHNPGTMVNVTQGKPLKVFPTTFLIPQNEMAFKSMLNTAQDELTNSGYIAELLDQYVSHPGTFYLPAKPYQD